MKTLISAPSRSGLRTTDKLLRNVCALSIHFGIQAFLTFF